MFGGAFWDDVLGDARENIGSLFPSRQQSAQDWGWFGAPATRGDEYGWINAGQPSSEGFGWVGGGGYNAQGAPTNPFTRALEQAHAARLAASPAPVKGPYYGGQFDYETQLSLSADPETQRLVRLADAAAEAAGIDREVFRRQINQESRFNPRALSSAGAKGLGQLMDPTARELGVSDPYDPQQNLSASARYLKQHLDYYKGDYVKALAAYNAGRGTVDASGDNLSGEPAIYVNNILAGAKRREAQASPNPATKPLRGLTAYQYGSESLATGAADYICGPIAAQAFAKYHGRNPTLAESLGMARSLGVIDPENGMHGIDSTAQLIRALGAPATVDNRIDMRTIIGELAAGRPVIINTPTHYFVIEDYDQSTGKFDFGNSARTLRRSRGQTWYTIDELNSVLGAGAARGAIYAR